MSVAARRNWSFFSVVIAWACFCPDARTAAAAEPSVLMTRLQGKVWATLSSEQGGYQLRLLTDQEKTDAEKTIEQYRASRSGEKASDDAEAERVMTAYRAMPSDVRVGRFYRITKSDPGFVELFDKELHAMLPLASVRIILFGPTGRPAMQSRFGRSASADRSPSPEDFLRALRGGGGGSALSSRGAVTGNAGGLTGLFGGLVRDDDQDAKDEPKSKQKLTLFAVKYAKAAEIADVIRAVYEDHLKARIAVDERINAVIVYGESKAIEEVKELIEALDTAGKDDRKE